jgi:hypothetical protein
MKRHLGLPSGKMTTTLLIRIQQLNTCLPYLLGTGIKFDTDDVREMVFNYLFTYVHTINAISENKWYDKYKSDVEVCAYFDCLILINSLAQGEKRESKSASKKQVTYFGKKSSFEKKSFKHRSSSQNKTNVSNASSVIWRNMKRICAASSWRPNTKLKTSPSKNPRQTEQADMSSFSGAYDNIKEMPEI